ncbi:MAG: hypothetical protein ABSD74_20130 [Rhizomicrobium sp.]
MRKDPDTSLIADTITFFYERRLLDEWEYRFCQSRMRLRSLTSAQLGKRRDINQKVLTAIKRHGFQGPQ